MNDFLGTVAAAVVVAVIGFPFLLAKKSLSRAIRLIEIFYALALLVSTFFMGISIGLSWADGVPSTEDASREFLKMSWMALGAVAAAGVAHLAIRLLHED